MKNILSFRFYKTCVWVIFVFVSVTLIGVILGLIPLYRGATNVPTIQKTYYLRNGLIFDLNNTQLANELIQYPNLRMLVARSASMSSDFKTKIGDQVIQNHKY